MTPEELRATVSRNIRERRRELHITQVGLATACEVDQSTISSIESGKIGVTDKMLAKISEVLHVHPAALFMLP